MIYDDDLWDSKCKKSVDSDSGSESAVVSSNESSKKSCNVSIGLHRINSSYWSFTSEAEKASQKAEDNEWK